jgi:regulator of sigma D
MSAFGKSYDQRRRKYNKLVDRHLAQMDERIQNYIRLIKLDSIAERGIADNLGENLHIFSLEDITYILNGIHKELPASAIRIAEYIDAMPGTPVPRGYGVSHV